MVVIASFLPTADNDLKHYYYPFAQGCLECAFLPYYAYWLLWPLALIPQSAIYAVMTAITVSGVLYACYQSGVNPLVVMLSFPMLGQVWLGQIDVVPLLGLTLATVTASPLLIGLGLVIMLIKPQVVGLAAVVIFLSRPRREWPIIAAIPVVVLVMSFIVYGLDWPIRWINQAAGLPDHIWRYAAGDIWPVGLVIGAAVLLWWQPGQKRVELALIWQTIAAPWAGVYSWVIWLARVAPWWVLPLSYAWLLGYPWLGRDAMRLAWVLPVAVFGWLMWRQDETI